MECLYFIESKSGWHIIEEDTVESASVALINIKFVDKDAFSVVNNLKQKNPLIKCIFYSNNSTYGDVIYAFEKGIEGFLSLEADEKEILLALESVLQGKTYIQQDLMKEILLISNKLSYLTLREKQIYDMLCKGFDKQEICANFKISQRTCENYFAQLYSKLGVNSIQELQQVYGVTKKRSINVLPEDITCSRFYISPDKLTLFQDDSYDGEGVKIIYKNVPAKASVLEITLYKGNKSEQVSFMENTPVGKNHEFFNLGFYIYPFLAAGKEYTFDFVFKSSNRKILEKESITVVASKGREIIIDQEQSNIIINAESLECTFSERPEINLPKESRFCINVWDNNWKYLGDLSKDLCDFDCFEPINFYKDINYRIPKAELETVKKVIFHFYFAYECYEWNYFISGVMLFDSKKL